MARKKTIVSGELPYHVTARCINREWFCLPLPAVWEIMENMLHFVHFAYGFRIHAFVLMNNHFHLIVRAPEKNLSAGMNYFMRETSREIGRRAHRINQTYGARFHRCLINNSHYFLHAYKYVYRNPVEAGIVRRPEDYSYSTLPGLLGRQKVSIPVEFDDTLFNSVESTLSWLNKKPSKENHEYVRKALRKQEFQLGIHRNSGKDNPLEHTKY